MDYSQSRNVVSGRIYNQIVHSRDIDDELSRLPNGGVVEGFPVLIYLNGDFLGLYTLNIPKDAWMFGMDGEGHQALLFGDDWTESTALAEEIADPEDVLASGWDLEYCSTEDSEEGTAWAAESMNEFIRFLLENEGQDFLDGIGNYTDLDRAIDVFIYTFFIHGMDNLSKNILWASYDGVKWIPSMYDMDSTWGMLFTGAFPFPADSLYPFGSNVLFERLLDTSWEKISLRYLELRAGPLSYSNIEEQFTAFFDAIPNYIYEAEAEKWPDVPSHEENNPDQILAFAKGKIAFLDEYFGVNLEEELSLVPSDLYSTVGNKITCTASVPGMEEGDRLLWKVKGALGCKVSENGMSCSTRSLLPGTIKFTATLVGSDGAEKCRAETEVTVKLSKAKISKMKGDILEEKLNLAWEEQEAYYGSAEASEE